MRLTGSDDWGFKEDAFVFSTGLLTVLYAPRFGAGLFGVLLGVGLMVAPALRRLGDEEKEGPVVSSAGYEHGDREGSAVTEEAARKDGEQEEYSRDLELVKQELRQMDLIEDVTAPEGYVKRSGLYWITEDHISRIEDLFQKEKRRQEDQRSD